MAIARIVQRRAARRDLVAHFVYLAENASVETTRRSRQAAEDTYTDLSRMPRMGAPGKVRAVKFAGVRLWRVKGFEKYLIVYRPIQNGVQIERVIHASQDYQRVLER